LVERIATTPHLGYSQRAQARLAEWLEATANTPAGAGVAALLEEHPIVSSLIASLAEFSPYLWRLARDDPDRLLRVLNADPEVYLAARLVETTKAV
jgi:glutamate-ammonia-ligase adenylyltransferase